MEVEEENGLNVKINDAESKKRLCFKHAINCRFADYDSKQEKTYCSWARKYMDETDYCVFYHDN